MRCLKSCILICDLPLTISSRFCLALLKIEDVLVAKRSVSRVSLNWLSAGEQQANMTAAYESSNKNELDREDD